MILGKILMFTATFCLHCKRNLCSDKRDSEFHQSEKTFSSQCIAIINENLNFITLIEISGSCCVTTDYKVQHPITHSSALSY